MAELTSQERLQPSLLDRLTDTEPDNQKESRNKRVLSMRRLRESVMRDLEWLLNSCNLAAVQDLSDYPEAANSVINYGMPDLAGGTASGYDVGVLERVIRQAIWDFEPRLLRESVKVRALLSGDRSHERVLAFDIEGLLWAQPLPLQLYLKTEVDLVSGNVSIVGQGKAEAG